MEGEVTQFSLYYSLELYGIYIYIYIYSVRVHDFIITVV